MHSGGGFQSHPQGDPACTDLRRATLYFCASCTLYLQLLRHFSAIIIAMKVLVSAVACNPTRGSESHFGWAAVRALSQRHDLWVLAHGNDRPAIEAAVSAGELSPDVRFFYHHGRVKWGRSRLVSRLKAWRNYSVWSRSVEARKVSGSGHGRHVWACQTR